MYRCPPLTVWLCDLYPSRFTLVSFCSSFACLFCFFIVSVSLFITRLFFFPCFVHLTCFVLICYRLIHPLICFFFLCFVYLNLFCFYLLPPHPPSHLFFFLFCMYIDSICLVVLCVNLFIAGFGTRFDFVVLYTLACLLDRSLYNYLESFHLYFLPTFFRLFSFLYLFRFLLSYSDSLFSPFIYLSLSISLFVVTFLLPLVLFLSLFFLFFLF